MTEFTHPTRLPYRTRRSALQLLWDGRLRIGRRDLTEPGECALVVSSGSFGERWAAMAARYGADVDHLRYPWGETPDPLEVRARIEGATVVYVVHSETSTGVVSDVQALAAAAREAVGRARALATGSTSTTAGPGP